MGGTDPRYRRASGINSLTHQWGGLPFQEVIKYILPNYFEPKPLMKTERPGIEAVHGRRDGKLSALRFLLNTLHQNGTHTFLLHIGMHGDIYQVKLTLQRSHPKAAAGLTINQNDVITGIRILLCIR